MTFSAYVQRQKTIIRQKSGNFGQLATTEQLFKEIESLQGLNTRQRALYRHVPVVVRRGQN
jgi:hypothetical protein